MKGGPAWSDVIARVTADAVSGEILDSELARDLWNILHWKGSLEIFRQS